MNAHLPQQQLIDELLQMNVEAVKCIEGHASYADNLVSSLMASATKLQLPANVSKRLEELGKSIDDSAIEEDQAKMNIVSSNEEGECKMKDAADDDPMTSASASPNISKVEDRPIKRRRSIGHLRKSKGANQLLPPEYDEGMLVYPNPLLIDGHFHDCPEVLLVVMFNIGQLQLQRHQEDVALRFFQLADEVLKICDPQLNSSEHHLRSQLAILHQVAYTHFRKKEFKSALEALKQVLHLAEQHYGHHHQSTAAALHCIGTVKFHLRNNENQTMQILKQALFTRKFILGSRHKDVATTLNNIGRVYFDCGETENALSYYEKALQIRTNLFGRNHVDVAATTFNIGQAHHRMGHLEEALTRYSNFYSFVSRFGSRNQHRDEVVALKHMGQVYQEQKNIVEARSCYQEAINVSIMACGQEHDKETASILNIYGNMLYEAGSFDKAAEVYEQGLAIERRVLEPCCVNIVVTLSNIGQALMQQGDYRRALCRYTEAYAILSLQPEKDVKKLTETLSIIGQISNLLGNHTQAVKAFQEVISIRKAVLGDHVDVALALNYLGLLYFKRGSLDLAMKNFEESLRVRRSCTPNSTSADIAVLSYNIGSIYLHRGDNERALKYYQDSLDVERATYGNVHHDVAVTLQLIGKVNEKCGKYEEAIHNYTEAVDIWKACVGGSSNGITTAESQRKYKLNAAKLLVSIGSVQLRQGNVEQMHQHLSEAHRIFRDEGVPPDELKVAGFSLYELSLLHPQCAAAA
jgi:tetratricopeptide (TPR) repeat protein